MSVLDRYLVHRFQEHKLPAVAAALMWLTLLGPIAPAPWRLGGRTLMLREAEWFWEIRTWKKGETQFLFIFTSFLSNHKRSGNLLVGSAISITHSAQVCAQKAWTGILALDHPFGSENWRYVHSAIPNALPDNILDRLLVYFYEAINLLIFGDAPYERSHSLTHEMIIQNIKVSQNSVSSSLVH